MHGARRISTLLSSFRDVILLLAIVGEMQAGMVTFLSLSRSRGFSFSLSLSHSLSLSLSLSSPFLSLPNDFKVVAENRFANPWRKRHRAASTSISLRIAPTRLCLFLPFVIYNGFSLFFSKLRTSRRLPKLIATLLYNCACTKRPRKVAAPREHSGPR